MDEQRSRQAWRTVGWVSAALLALLWLQQILPHVDAPREVPFSEMLDRIEAGAVESAVLRGSEVVVTLRDPPAERTPSPAGVTSDGAATVPATAPPSPVQLRAMRRGAEGSEALIVALRSHGARFTFQPEDEHFWQPLLLGWLLPLLVLVGLAMLASRRLGQGPGPLAIGRAQSKMYDRGIVEAVTFEDVAGVDEARGELVEIVSYLKDPGRYRELGARSPKGVLLVGPPGTGKTLLARAVAGEAQVPFFSISGSEFVQMFVGVGAARVRDLFEQAKQKAPCIVFIDELDAIGRARAGAVSGFAVHEEREQTLNQLLVELDGFDPGKGVVILAATNRPEVLDAALLRAGRFDRQVVVERPDVRGREAILMVHARKVRLGADVVLRTIAQRTPGMAGADLANVVNEAALAASRRAGHAVEARDFEEAVDRIQLGLQKKGRVMSAPERERIAFHESGHALVARTVTHADPVHRVTIIPRSIGALGATLQLPEQERALMTRPELEDRLCVLLAGREAEAVVFGDVSTGAENDLARATEMSRQMVCRFGMSERLGPVSYGDPRGAGTFEARLGLDNAASLSEATLSAIDAEIRTLVEAAAARARRTLEARRSTLERVARKLLEVETLDRAELEALVVGDGATSARAAGDPGGLRA